MVAIWIYEGLKLRKKKHRKLIKLLCELKQRVGLPLTELDIEVFVKGNSTRGPDDPLESCHL